MIFPIQYRQHTRCINPQRSANNISFHYHVLLVTQAERYCQGYAMRCGTTTMAFYCSMKIYCNIKEGDAIFPASVAALIPQSSLSPYHYLIWVTDFCTLLWFCRSSSFLYHMTLLLPKGVMLYETEIGKLQLPFFVFSLNCVHISLKLLRQ